MQIYGGIDVRCFKMFQGHSVEDLHILTYYILNEYIYIYKWPCSIAILDSQMVRLYTHMT